jgi:flagellar hook protein FlgE
MLQSVNMSLTAVKSMQAIDDWMDTVNANLNGLAKTAFKESDISFGGNITYTLRTPRQDQAGEMVGEQALTVGATRINGDKVLLFLLLKKLILLFRVMVFLLLQI